MPSEQRVEINKVAMAAFRSSVNFQFMFVRHSGLEMEKAIDHVCAAAERLVNATRAVPPAPVVQIDEAEAERIRIVAYLSYDTAYTDDFCVRCSHCPSNCECAQPVYMAEWEPAAELKTLKVALFQGDIRALAPVGEEGDTARLACLKLDELDWLVGYELTETNMLILDAALDLARKAIGTDRDAPTPAPQPVADDVDDDSHPPFAADPTYDSWRETMEGEADKEKP